MADKKAENGDSQSMETCEGRNPEITRNCIKQLSCAYIYIKKKKVQPTVSDEMCPYLSGV